MKKIIYILISLLLISISILVLSADKTLDKDWYNLYKTRIEEICKRYKPEKNIITTIEYKQAETNNNKSSNSGEIVKSETNNNKSSNSEDIVASENAFKLGKDTYEKNMNNIYKCAILNIQLTTLKLLKEDILQQSNNPELSKEVESKIENEKNKVLINISALKCNTNNLQNESIQKKNILKQTTYELCKYNSYLEYLREYNSKYENLIINDDSKDFNSLYIVNLEKNRKNQIDQEINHIYKVYPLAFNAYKEYENNLLNHLLLELIKNDYKVLREKLHSVLNPINQVVYKISNAMQE